MMLLRNLGVICVSLAAPLISGCVANGGVATAPTAALSPTASAPQEPGTDQGLVEEGSASDAAATGGSVKGEPAQAAATTLAPGQAVKLEPVRTVASASAAMPPRAGRSLVYRCNGGRSITLDNMRSSVSLVDPDGEIINMPAAPAGQTSRYGQKPYALVLDGNEALYVKPRKPPFTCKR